MNITSCRSRTKIETGISFPVLQSWNPMTCCATIVAQVDGRRVMCRIAAADLKKKFRPSEPDPMQAVTEHRIEVENAARKLIESNAFEEDGSILIRYDDL